MDSLPERVGECIVFIIWAKPQLVWGKLDIECGLDQSKGTANLFLFQRNLFWKGKAMKKIKLRLKSETLILKMYTPFSCRS